MQGWARLGCEEAKEEEGEVGEGPTVLWMAGGSPFNELLLWPSSTSQSRCAGLRCKLIEEVKNQTLRRER